MDGQVHKNSEHEAQQVGLTHAQKSRLNLLKARMMYISGQMKSHSNAVMFHKDKLHELKIHSEQIKDEIEGMEQGQMEFEVGP